MIKSISNKFKIIVIAGAFVLISAGMYLFGFGIVGGKNQMIADAIAQRNVELEVLQREQKSFEQGKKDLAILQKSQYPPDELFSSDTKVVKEIQQLEAAAQRYNLKLTITVSGSVKAATPVTGTLSQLFAIPYTVTLDGTFSNILQFVQAAERMPFVTHIDTFAVDVTNEKTTRATLSSEFYIKK